ncbi:DUF1697 domain-containing protein [Neobacillus terrae]|uniref:DUF1697 domain-containing protein n=1 Tax=Neobacillus terrae TaxID=3034837 RepID=UPI0014077EEB|nr:DUF1697 domain-containing protein [Neobacillus terrae]NHM30905.1 DUF1697 domain-containing protein [Neobacillus terrae]
MTIYIALLRGINVGGNNIIKMKDLKKMFFNMGIKKVETYIQSGNIVFQSDNAAEKLQSLIHEEIKNTFGFSVPVILRTAAEWNEVMRNCPYQEDLKEGESIHLTLLDKEPLIEVIEQLLRFKSESEECYIRGKDVYLYLRKSILDSKISNQLQKLKVPVTSRNWKTIKKLEAMIYNMEKPS